MKAMLFAAGLGTRLRPLTNDRPKALVEVSGKSLLHRNIEKLLVEGCTEVIVNIHYFGEQILASVEARPEWKGKVFTSDERSKILETGGGLLHAKSHFIGGSDFLVHNVDILSDLDLRKGLYATHQQRAALLTLATRQRDTSRYLLFGQEDNLLCGWTNIKTGEIKLSRNRPPDTLIKRAYSGISAYSPRIFHFMPQKEGSRFSIVDTWLEAAKTEAIYCYPHDEDRWIDVGRPEKVKEAEDLFSA